MKQPLTTILLCALLATASCASLTKSEPSSLTASSSHDDTHWHVDITHMNTLRYGSRMVTPDFFLEMRGDTLWSNLPYLGNAFRSDMGETEGVLNFELPVRNLEVTQPKKHRKRLSLDIRKRTELLHYTIELEDTDRATIWVRSNSRDAISFDGNIIR